MQNKRPGNDKGPARREGAPRREESGKKPLRGEEPREERDDSFSRIEGRNAVREALRAGKTVERLYVQDGLRRPVRIRA